MRSVSPNFGNQQKVYQTAVVAELSMSYVWMIIGDLLVSERSPIGLQKVMFYDVLAIVFVFR